MASIPKDKSDDCKIIASILKYLTGTELREARLVSQEFNEIICSRPELLWGKNSFLIQVPATFDRDYGRNVERIWAEIWLNGLITRRCCPNFHFYKTDLETPEATEFFQSSVRQQIRFMKMTDCKLSGNDLLHILTCVSQVLEHLEITGFSKFEEDATDSSHFNGSYLPALTTIILKCHFGEDCSRNKYMLKNFWNCVLDGAPKLRNISVVGWRSETCEDFVEVLALTKFERKGMIQSLEIECIVEMQLHAVQQFSFFKTLEVIQLPRLRRLSIKFSREIYDTPGLSMKLVQDLTQSIARFIESSAGSLRTLELINCPVSNGIFGCNISQYPSLSFVSTKGSFVTELDNEGNIISGNRISKSSSLLRRRKQETTNSRSMTLLDNVRLMNTIPQSGQVYRTTGQFSSQEGYFPFPLNSLPRSEIYKIACMIGLLSVSTHFGLGWLFKDYPAIGNQLEVLLHAWVAFWWFKSEEVVELWNSRQR